VVLLNYTNQLIAYVLNERLTEMVENAHILSQAQGGFRQNKSTDVNGCKLYADNQDHTLRFRRDAHGSTFPCFFEILFIFKGFLKSCDIFTTHMCLGVICTAPYAHGSTFKTTNTPTCTRSPHTISRRVHISKCSTYFASHISPWSRYHLLAGMMLTIPRLHVCIFFRNGSGVPVLVCECL
jgi:hypothetical protein